jgi:hypothetical protein
MPSVAGKAESLTSSAQITGGNNLFGGVKYGVPRALVVAHDVNQGVMFHEKGEIAFLLNRQDFLSITDKQ